MSLWEKWEKEKLEKQGIKVESRRDIEVQPEYVKPNLGKQILVVVLVVLGCFAIALASVAFEAAYSGRRWSETFLVRLLWQREQQREAISRR